MASAGLERAVAGACSSAKLNDRAEPAFKVLSAHIGLFIPSDYPSTTMEPTMNLAFLKSLWQTTHPVVAAIDALRNPFLLLSRLYVAQVFFMSGLTKLNDWGTTVALFTDEYKVPLLSPSVAAFMGTAGELVLPVMLVLGLCGRFAALGLFVVNAVAVIALTDIPAAALQQHVFWAWVLALLVIVGLGSWSADAALKKRWASASGV
jgi:putative oxidoreductase